MIKIHWLQQFGVRIVAATVVLTAQLDAADLRVVTEYIYPTAYEVRGGSIGVGAGAGGAGIVQETVVVPTEFATREVGVVFSVEATVSSMNHDATAISSLEPRNKNGNTELMIAATQGKADLARKLLGRGVMVNAKNNFGSSALMGASAGGFDEIVQMLLAKGATPDSKSRNGSTALMFAAKNGHKQVVDQLLVAGANVNSTDSEGLTALMYAVNGGYAEVVEHLLSKGAKPDCTDRHGTSPKALALKKSDKNVLVMLTRSPAAR
jgi:hypothetical protein